MADGPRVALALGSGGARGYAHIGAIQVLQERGAEVVSVAGSSMGALVGGVLAADRLDEYTDWVTGLRQLDMVRLLDPSLSAPGAIRAGKIVARVRELLAGARIEDLPVPFTAVATDLYGRKEVWFQRGPVDAAIRASIAIPGIVTPVVLNGRVLADGGLMNPVPIAPTAGAGADLTVAVSLGGEPGQRGAAPDGPPVEEAAPLRESSEPRPAEEWAERLRSTASQLLDRDLLRGLRSRLGAGESGPPDDEEQGPGGELTVFDDAAEEGGATDLPDDVFGTLPAGLGKFDMMYQSIDAMQSVLIRYRLAGYPPDVLVEVPRDACRSLDFHRAAEMIELGRTLTGEALDRAGVLPAP